MSAKILTLPIRRVRPLGEHELPVHWSRALRSYYAHVTYDGFKSHEDAYRYCEAMAAVPAQQPGEHEMQCLLRHAQAAIAQLPLR